MKAFITGLVFLVLLIPGTAISAEGAGTAGGLELLAGVWRPDLEITSKGFAMPADLKRDLQEITITITAPASGKDGKMLLEWPDGTNQTLTLKLAAQKGKALTLKVDGKHDLEVDLTEKDVLVFHEEPNRLILKRVPVDR